MMKKTALKASLCKCFRAPLSSYVLGDEVKLRVSIEEKQPVKEHQRRRDHSRVS